MAVDYKALKDGGFMRQKQKNQFSLRLKVVGGNLTAAQIATIAQVAEQYGEGRVHLTSRQSVEIPFIKLENIEEVKADLGAGGVNTGVCGPRVRTITACQGDEICPSGCIDTYSLAKELSARYFGKQLPHKFKFGVTGCQNNCLKAEENDLGVKGGYTISWEKGNCTFCRVCEKVCRTDAINIAGGEITVNDDLCNYCGRCVKSCPTDAWHGESGYILSFGGLFGNSIAKGRSLLPIIPDKETLFNIADAAVEFFVECGSPGERFKFTADRVGWDELEKRVREAYNG